MLKLLAFIELVRFDFYLAQGRFSALYERVRDSPVAQRDIGPDQVQRICKAVDEACVWYWKEARCLQRSAATACLMKRFGITAEMVIGVRQMPFEAHAWVEVDRRVVNDKPYVPEAYTVIDRC